MSSLPNALRRSKEAWAAVGKPERAAAVLRDGAKIMRKATYRRIYAMVRVEHILRTDWRAIVPKKREADDVEAWKIRAIYALEQLGEAIQAARSSRARRDLVAKVEALLKELEGTR